MPRVLLNLDAGELDDEPVELVELVDLAHVACGGHAGDDTSMQRIVVRCIEAGTQVGAHPSFVDREGFGRRRLEIPHDVLTRQIDAQCAALRAHAERAGATLVSAKLHGALYHAAHVDAGIARASLQGVVHALGPVTIVGLSGGALEAAARDEGLAFWREGFADRRVRADGTLVPRGEPGAVLDQPADAAAQTERLAARGDVETVCVHSDSPRAVEIARAVREALGPKRRPT